jgi:hypothetical protein
MDVTANKYPLGYTPIGRLMLQFSIPSISADSQFSLYGR